MTRRADAGSFRDPSGFVFIRDGVVHRQVNEVYRPHYDHLLSSGLYQELVQEGLLVPHSEVELGAAPAPDAYKVLAPEPVSFISYPYEWCFGQLKEAALTTLRIQSRALDHGMSLRDASAYNIQFQRGAAVLIDTLSFEIRDADRPWSGYRQFCQHFLGPLAVMSMLDVRLGQLARVHLDGLPLDLVRKLLPARAALKPGLALHIRAHARTQQRHGAGQHRGDGRQARVGERGLRGLIDSLTGTVQGMDWQPPPSTWRDYYDGDSYAPEAFAHKLELVGTYLSEVGPRSVWDLGANIGRFARLAADSGASTVAFDADPSAVEAAYRDLVADGETGVLPLVVDLANPSPSIGWQNRERRSLQERAPADLVLALALVHHLAIANNVPLPRVAEQMREFGEWLVIEFVPKSDPKVQALLASRDDIFPDYTQEGFEAAFAGGYAIERRDALVQSERTLYLLRGR